MSGQQRMTVYLCYRPDDSTPIHVNIIHIDARTIRTFMHYCTGR